MGARSKFAARQSELFNRQRGPMTSARGEMYGEHSRLGRLQSGATVVATLGILEQQSFTALEVGLGEVAKMIEHRGRDWRLALSGVEDALESHMLWGRSFVGDARRLSSPESSSLDATIASRLEDVAAQLRTTIGDHRAGFAAPPAKPFKDRRPLVFAALLLLIGALLGQLVTAGGRMFFKVSPSSQAG